LAKIPGSILRQSSPRRRLKERISEPRRTAGNWTARAVKGWKGTAHEKWAVKGKPVRWLWGFVFKWGGEEAVKKELES